MHTFVMSVLFPRNNFLGEMKRILKLSMNHGLLLGSFVAIYKSILLLLKKIHGK